MSETLEKTFTVLSPAHLNLSNIRGTVEIRPGEQGVIHVTATKDDSSGDAKRTAIEFTQEEDGTVKVATRFPEGAWSWLWGSFPCKVDYVIRVPVRCSLKVNSVSGSIQAGGFEGDFNIQSVSGSVTLQNLTGPVKVKTVSGELQLADLTGDLNLNTVSGKVTGKHILGHVQLESVSGGVALDESTLGSLAAKTVSGGMRYQTALGAGPYQFNSVSGNVELMLPPGTRCSVELRAVSGKLFTKLPATSISRQNGSQVAEIQGGGVAVRLQSVSGNLAIN